MTLPTGLQVRLPYRLRRAARLPLLSPRQWLRRIGTWRRPTINR